MISGETGPKSTGYTVGASRRWYQFRVRTLLLVATGVCVATAVSVAVWREANDPLRWQKRFRRAVSSADRLVVRDGGYDCCGPVDGQKVLFEVVDPSELNEVRDHLEFVPGRPSSGCLCCGYPGMDWYRGKRRVALTAVPHGTALRWKGFPGDASLTDQSAQWLRHWFRRHGLGKKELRW